MKTTFKISILFFLVLITLVSCKKKEEQTIIEVPIPLIFQESFSAKVNGTNFNAFDLLIAGTLSIESGLYFLNATGVDISNSDTVAIAITFIGGNFDNLSDGEVFSGSNTIFDNQVVGSYIRNFNSSNNLDLDSGDNLSAEATITSIDKANKVFSGNFNFFVQDSLGTTYTITEGEFIDVSYD